MEDRQVRTLVSLLLKAGVAFEPGLTDEEVGAVQHKFSLQFPPDLRLLLQHALPVQDTRSVPENVIRSPWAFVSWREGLRSKTVEREILERLAWPLDGMLFDVEHNRLWLRQWGERPDTPEERRVAVEAAYARYPRLIPIFSHRYIPGLPAQAGNPVFFRLPDGHRLLWAHPCGLLQRRVQIMSAKRASPSGGDNEDPLLGALGGRRLRRCR